ncbi:MAG: FAD-dependent oxidoreductase [Defluviitaleaceae bacterium]|nr:FAD-dependent oxidoreductase [Defluviitaleaceae bacterium]
MLDIAIIGAGPAGLSAGINAIARGREAAVFGRGVESSFLYKAEKVDNHLGLPGLSGSEMLDKFYNHAKSLGVDIRNGRVLQILPMGDYFSINFDNMIENSRTIILATGIVKGDKIEGEEEFLGKGVSYCATCDGMLYRGKEVAVVGNSEEAMEDAEFLSKIAAKVHLVKSKPIRVTGEQFVTAIETKEGIIPCQGVFFIKETMPFDSLIAGIELDGGLVKVDRLQQTNIPGVFAAGDCTGWPYQLSKAVGEGLVAAQQADRYISKENK